MTLIFDKVTYNLIGIIKYYGIKNFYETIEGILYYYLNNVDNILVLIVFAPFVL